MVRHTALKLAEVKRRSLDEITDLTSRNAERFFGIVGTNTL
jgi:Tat protein secretion system quality control protein TatD with DNase activity